MKTILAVALMLTCVLPGVSAQGEEQLMAAARNRNAFAMDLYARLKDGSGNIFFSPYSIATGLTMLYAGARENTAGEMAQVLYISPDEEALHQTLAAQQALLNSPGGYELTVANSLWGRAGDVFLPEFLSLLKDNYGAAPEQVDFTQPQIAAGIINTWVSDRTRAKIKEIVPPDLLGDQTRLVLVNAVYFKGSWASPFKKVHTQNRQFYLTPADPKWVPMMNQLNDLAYMEDDRVQVLEMAYAGDELAMMFILPRKIDGLKDIEGVLNAEDVRFWARKLVVRQVDVSLPQFRTESQFRLAEVLAAMGMPGVFNVSADLSGMAQESGLYVSDVLHKTFAVVTEEGTEAAAVTAVVTDEAIVFEEPLDNAAIFKADHPFIYLIRDKRTDAILFMGRVTDPGVAGRPVSEVLGGMFSEVFGQALQSRKNMEQGE